MWDWVDPLGLACLSAKELKRSKKQSERIIEDAKQGKRKLSPDYHGRLSPEKELEILSSPDAKFVSTGKSRRLQFVKDGNTVITESGTKRGQIITSYGPAGPRGESGAAIFGGSPNDPGMPITKDMVLEGKVPKPGGGFEPLGVEI